MKHMTFCIYDFETLYAISRIPLHESFSISSLYCLKVFVQPLMCSGKSLDTFRYLKQLIWTPGTFNYSPMPIREEKGYQFPLKRPACLKFQTLIPDAENPKISIFSYSQIENYIVSTSNNVDFYVS